MYFDDLQDGFTSQEILCSSSHRLMNEKQIVFKEQNLFPGKDEWPSTTNVHCWYCTHNFKCMPVSIPVEYTDEWWHVKGVFCSFSCAKSYIIRNSKGDYKDLMLLNSFANLCFNQHKEITMSPPFHVLKKFGGSMTIEEFRKKGSNGEVVESMEGHFKPCSAAIQIQTDKINTKGFRVGQVMGIRRNNRKKNNETKQKKSLFDDFVKTKG